MGSRESAVETWSIEDSPDGWVLHVHPRAPLASMLPVTLIGWLGLVLAAAFSLLLLANSIENPLTELPLVFAVPFAILGAFMWWLYLKPPALQAWRDANEVFDLRISNGHFTHEGSVYDAHVLKTLRVVPASRPGCSRLAFDGDVFPDIAMLSDAGVATDVAEQVRAAVLNRLQQGC